MSKIPEVDPNFRPEFDGMPISGVPGLVTRAVYDARDIQPILPLTPENFSERWGMLSARITKAKEGKTGNLVTPGTAVEIGREYGIDALQKALAEGLIAVG